MRFKNKRRIIGMAGMMTAVIVLAGCGGCDIQNTAAPEEPENISQLPQDPDGENLAEELSQSESAQSEQQGQFVQPEQSEQPEQLVQPEMSTRQAQSEQQGQPDQSGPLPGTETGDRAQGRLDADRILEEQSFQTELNDWGTVRFVSYEPDPAAGDPLDDVTFYLVKGEEVLYQFPQIGTNGESGYGMYYDVKFVLFTDTNADGKEDVVIGVEYMTGAGSQGAIPHVVVRIYEDQGDYFTYNEGFSDTVNEYLPWESNVLARDVKRLIQLTGGKEPLTDYESYSGKWRVSTGFIAAYEDPSPVSRNELTCSIRNGNEFSGSLFTEQGMTERFASVDDIAGTIEKGELFYEFEDDGWGGTGTLHITFLPNQINVDVLNYQMAEENVIGYGISGNYEMTVRE